MRSMDFTRIAVAICGAYFVSSCGGGHDCPTPNVDLAVCDPSNAPFSLTIDNPYFPIAIGDQLVLEGAVGSRTERVEITVLSQVETVAGVATRVVERRDLENGQLVEVSRNFYTQAPDGTVCNFGRQVDQYSGGVIVGHDGAWRAEGTNSAGIVMPATPTAGQAFSEESAPGIVKDVGKIVATDATVVTPAGTFTNVVEMENCDPFSGHHHRTFFAPTIGLVTDDAAQVIIY